MRYSGKLFRNYGCDFAEVMLVFSSDKLQRGTRNEYRVLRLSDWAKISPGTDGLKDENSIKRQFAEILDDRFVFKDLYFADGIHAIFERVAE
jgi:hypothetical protein